MEVPGGDVDHIHVQLLRHHLLGDRHGIPGKRTMLAAEVHLAAVGGHRIHLLFNVLAAGGVPGTIVHVHGGAEGRAGAGAIVGDRVEFDGSDQPIVLEPDFGVYPVLVHQKVPVILPAVDAFHGASRSFGQQRSDQLALAKSPVAVFAALIQGGLIHLVGRHLIESGNLRGSLGYALDIQVFPLAAVLIFIPIGQAAGRIGNVRSIRREHKVEFDGLVRLPEADLNIAIDLLGKYNVAFGVGARGLGGSARFDAFAGIGDVRSYLPFHLDQPQGLFAEVFAFGDHNGPDFGVFLV